MAEYAANLIGTNIEDEMRSSYLDYSMSVIVGRALPSARDGLKPVHRRILYAMFREGLLHNRRYSKCAGVVGEVLKKYHPHGDSAVYDALVRMAQPWNLRYPLIDGQGNFGNIDGDSAAAYRYTECRMKRMAEDLLSDIDKETVDFTENFDGQTVEPLVLPARVPNLLVNGSSGIAVGMATNIAPHNLGEVVDGTIALIDDPETTDEQLLEIIPGPDFPTGGVIFGTQGPREASLTGRGRIRVRGVAEIETDANGDDKAIVITEIPYQVNKSRLVESIATLVRHKKIDGIRDLRDESDRTGMRIYIELKRDAIGQIVLNHLFKQTALQTTFGAINLALVHGRPAVLTVREILQEFIAHRKEVTIRRCRFELAAAEARAHVLEGYLKALDHIDEIIKIIRASADTDIARAELIARFAFTHVQAQAILDMRLARLTGLEREKLEAEYAATLQQIELLRNILSSEALVMGVIKDELLEIRERYADERRTKIVQATGELSIEDLIADEDVVVTFSHLGYVKRTPLREYDAQRRGGTGKRGMGTRDEDFVRDLFVARTHDQLMIFTTMGRVYLMPVYEVPEGGRAARGRPIVNLVQLDPDEEVATVLDIREFDERSLVMITKGGMIKRTKLIEYKNIRTNGIIACNLKEDDQLLTVRLLEEESGSVLLATADGKSIHFEAEQAREMGRVARGVKGITLVSKDAVVGVEVTQEGLTLLTLTANGYGKRTPIEEYRKQNRGGIGLIDIKTRGRNGPVVGVAQVEDTDHLMIVTSMGKVIRTRVNEVSVIGRNTQGVRLIRLEKGEEVVAMARLPMDEQDDDDDLDDDGQGLEPDEEDASDADVESDEEEDFDEDAPDAPEDDEPEDDDDYEA
jgi:DNA gyrase subunit A